MEKMNIPNTIALLPGYSHLFSDNKISSPAVGQLLLCISLSFALGYYFVDKFYNRGEKNWYKAIGLLRIIKTKIRRLENQREKWKNCLDMTEDTCKQYYALLHYVTKKTVDVPKLASYFDYADSATSLAGISSDLSSRAPDVEPNQELEISEAN